MDIRQRFRKALIEEIQKTDKRLDAYTGELEDIDISNQTFIRGYRMGLIWAIQTYTHFENEEEKLEHFTKLHKYYEGGISHANKFQAP